MYKHGYEIYMTYLTVTILRVLGINNHGHFTVLYVFFGDVSDKHRDDMSSTRVIHIPAGV